MKQSLAALVCLVSVACGDAASRSPSVAKAAATTSGVGSVFTTPCASADCVFAYVRVRGNLLDISVRPEVTAVEIDIHQRGDWNAFGRAVFVAADSEWHAQVTYAKPPDDVYRYQIRARYDGAWYAREVRIPRQNACGGCEDEEPPMPVMPIPSPDPRVPDDPPGEPVDTPTGPPVYAAECSLRALDVWWGTNSDGDHESAMVRLRPGYVGVVDRLHLESFAVPSGERQHIGDPFSAPGYSVIHLTHGQSAWEVVLFCEDGRVLASTEGGL